MKDCKNKNRQHKFSLLLRHYAKNNLCCAVHISLAMAIQKLTLRLFSFLSVGLSFILSFCISCVYFFAYITYLYILCICYVPLQIFKETIELVTFLLQIFCISFLLYFLYIFLLSLVVVNI